jgi:hypothetical protein
MIYTCTTCRRPLIEVWSGWARCECGWLTKQSPMPWNRTNRYAHGSVSDPDGVKGRAAADALAIGAALLGPAPTDAEWYAEAESDPLWARFLDGDR